MNEDALPLPEGWSSLLPGHREAMNDAPTQARLARLENEWLPRFAARQRWYAAKGEPPPRLALTDYARWGSSDGSCLLAFVRAEDPARTLYFVPLALDWENPGQPAQGGAVVGPISGPAHRGLLKDAFAVPEFCREWVSAMGRHQELSCLRGRIAWSSTSAFAASAPGEVSGAPVRALSAESSNTTVRLGERLLLKVYRRLHAGVHPELELGRFLTEIAHFRHAVPLLGSAEYRGDDGSTTTLALLQEYIENQGDGWRYTLDHLQRFLGEEPALAPADAMRAGHDRFLALVRTLGRRTGELHTALSRPSGNPDFEPEVATDGDRKAWVARVHDDARVSLDLLAHRLPTLHTAIHADASALLASRGALDAWIGAHLPPPSRVFKTRYHGDYHLGQVLLTDQDFVIIDFEGEPARALAERREKHCALRDIASMLRSFNYAMYSALAAHPARSETRAAEDEDRGRRWEMATRAAFLEAYRNAADPAGLYATWDDAQHLIELFLMEKALYELRYELDHRPDWVSIPVKGVRDILSGPDPRFGPPLLT
ncbi:MAG: putative maltokinase [Betaproteobacteria bacterium]|nr:putative maltokinase [Betaproteobacteria bacterium]